MLLFNLPWLVLRWVLTDAIRISRFARISVSLDENENRSRHNTGTANMICCCTTHVVGTEYKQFRDTVRTIKTTKEVCDYSEPSIKSCMGYPCGFFSTEESAMKCEQQLARRLDEDARWKHISGTETEALVRRLSQCHRAAVIIQGRANDRHKKGSDTWRDFLAAQGYGAPCTVVLGDPQGAENPNDQTLAAYLDDDKLGPTPRDAVSSVENIKALAAGLNEGIAQRHTVAAYHLMPREDHFSLSYRIVSEDHVAITGLLKTLVIVFLDHGLPGKLVLPGGVFLERDDWLFALRNFHAAADQLLVYVGACFSGSMFSLTTLMKPDEQLEALAVQTQVFTKKDKLLEDLNHWFGAFQLPTEPFFKFLRDFTISLALCDFDVAGSDGPAAPPGDSKLHAALDKLLKDINSNSAIDIESLIVTIGNFLDENHDVLEELLGANVPCGIDETGRLTLSDCLSEREESSLWLLQRMYTIMPYDFACSGEVRTPPQSLSNRSYSSKRLHSLVYAFIEAQMQPRSSKPGEIALDDELALICKKRPNSCFGFAASLPLFTSLGFGRERLRKDPAGSFFMRSVLMDLSAHGGDIGPEGRLGEHVVRVQAAREADVESRAQRKRGAQPVPVVPYRDAGTGRAFERPGGHFDLFQPVAFGNGADMTIGGFFPNKLDHERYWKAIPANV